MQGPSGLARRRERISDEETERRMIDAAVAMVNRTGLTVSLDHLSFEDIIRDARVSRSTVYRRWPYKDLFFSDLLKELARAATPAAVSSEVASVGLIERVVREHLDWLETPELRQNLLLELVRQGAVAEFETMRGSTEWRTYLALHATYLSVADDELRRELGATLAASELDFTQRIAASWRLLAGLFGYRLRPETGATFEIVAAMAGADLRGEVLMALANPEFAARRIEARPFGALETRAWSPSALSLASIAWAFLEPDPDFEWTEARTARIVEALEKVAAGGV